MIFLAGKNIYFFLLKIFKMKKIYNFIQLRRNFKLENLLNWIELNFYFFFYKKVFAGKINSFRNINIVERSDYSNL
jgi:hypothetical protein